MNINWSDFFSAEMLEKLIRVGLILTIGTGIIYLITYFVKSILPQKWTKQRKMIINRTVRYSGFIILALTIISELQISLTPFFGAAGLIGLVVGVASQTSIGNIVSGFFLLSEKSFEIGDFIRVGDKSGTVLSVDLMSVKIRTSDNLYIRIPNQTVLGTNVTNVTRFPIRRMDLNVTVAYKEDLQKVVAVLKNILNKNPLCLDEPEPLIVFSQFGDNGIEIMVGVWTERSNFRKVKNLVIQGIKEEFEKKGIEIPFMQINIISEDKPASVSGEQAVTP